MQILTEAEKELTDSPHAMEFNLHPALYSSPSLSLSPRFFTLGGKWVESYRSADQW